MICCTSECRTNRRRKGCKTLFMSAWNVVGVLHSPNDKQTWWYLVCEECRLVDIARSHVVLVVPRSKVQFGEKWAPWSLSSSSSTIEMGNISLIVRVFRAR